MSSDDAVAIVTGCGRSNGIGAAVARRLAAAGAAVAVTDLVSDALGADDELDALVDDLAAAGASAMSVRGDVSSESDCERIVAAVMDRFGTVSILVNNAAAPHGPDRDFIGDVPLAAWTRQLEVNLTGDFLMTRAVVPEMTRRGYGRIVNIASAVGLTGTPKTSAYAASKAGIMGFTRAAAADLARSSITVNAICPGAIATARAISTATREGGAGSVDQALAARAAATPVGRVGTPADIAAAVAFLASRETGFITGQVLVVDGGASSVRV